VSGEEQPTRGLLPSFALYTASRLAIFMLALVGLVAVGLRGFLVLVGALAISGLVSFVLLSRQRAMFGAAVEASVAGRRAAHTAARAAEDSEGDPQN
jgi:hypothetical protein